MSFRKLAGKNLKLNTAKYGAYFLSSSFCIMTFFLYTVLILNRGTFNTGNYLSVRILTSIAVSVFINFSVFFIGYAYTAFIKARSYEFGLYLTHGMTNRELKKMVALETLFINLGSLLTGLISGTLFSRIFFLIALKISTVKGVKFSIGVRNYAATVGLFTFIFLVLSLYTHVKLGRMKAKELMKNKKVYGPGKFNFAAGISGVILIILSLCILFIHKASRSIIIYRNIYDICVSISILGLYLLFLGFGSLYSYIMKLNKNRYMKNLMKITQVNYRFSRNKNILFLLSVLGFMVIYYSGFGSSLSDERSRFSSQFNFDIIYIGDYGNQNEISRVYKILRDSGAELKKNDRVDYYELALFLEDRNKDKKALGENSAIISQSEFKKLSGFNISVNKGKSFIYPNVSRVHNLKWRDYNKLVLKNGNQSFTYSVRRNPFALALTEDNAMPDYVVILTDEDYASLSKIVGRKNMKSFYGFTLKDSGSAPEIIQRLRKGLPEVNGKIISKYKIFNMGGVEKHFARFIFTFTELLLFMISACILYFNLMLQIDEEKELYGKLFRIGITEDEMKQVVYSELRAMFYVPLFISSFAGSGFVWIITMNEPDRLGLMVNMLWTILGYFILYSIFFFAARNRFVREIREPVLSKL